MKFGIFILLSIITADLWAKNIKVEVISAEYPVEDHLQNKTLCLTIVRVPKTGRLLGVVENIYDCFYARTAARFPNRALIINTRLLSKVEMPELEYHLQRIDGQLEFYFSEGE
jgi:hypothetical protein